LYTGAAIMFAITSAEHQRMHDLLEEQGIEAHEYHNDERRKDDEP
jgi:predicted HTH domain antitoxin